MESIIINETSKALQQEISSYCYNNVNAVCRICLEKSQPHKELCSIFDFGDVSNMIMACTTVQVMNGDGLPNTICTKCLTRLQIAWQFKIQCESSDAKLRQFYFNNSEQVAFSSSIMDFDYGVKEEEELRLLKKETDRKRDIFNNSLELVTNQNNVLVHDAKCDLNRLKAGNVRLLLKQLKSDKKQQKTHQCETCGKTFNRRGYLTQHMRIHTGEKPYRCHLCEKRFVNSGHLTTHMRTHTGERPHPCTLCSKAFSTKQELHKHIMVHKGERPFICKMCGKRFGSSSNLYSHIKHHTGERNYTCEHCGKMFFTKQELKQHLVVHTGEKAFLCEYCNRRFSQVSHLKRHSKLHI